MNNRRLLIAAVFHFVHPVEKDLKTSQVDTKLCQLQLSKQTSFKMLHKLGVERDQRVTWVRKGLHRLYF